jgi:two-component system, NarL family, response regulator NreC
VERVLSPNTYRIVLADGHTLFRQAIKSALEEKPEFQVVGEAGEGGELLRLLDQTRKDNSVPHLVILDLGMPILRGVNALHFIKKNYPDMNVLVLSMHKDVEFATQAMAIGAKGYVLKEEANAELFPAIKAITEGGSFISPLILAKGCL